MNDTLRIEVFITIEILSLISLIQNCKKSALEKINY